MRSGKRSYIKKNAGAEFAHYHSAKTWTTALKTPKTQAVGGREWLLSEGNQKYFHADHRIMGVGLILFPGFEVAEEEGGQRWSSQSEGRGLGKTF